MIDCATIRMRFDAEQAAWADEYFDSETLAAMLLREGHDRRTILSILTATQPDFALCEASLRMAEAGAVSCKVGDCTGVFS